MNLEQFGEELKQTRLEKEISLMDISAETRISLKFLDAIEHGQFQILPQTYVRAFLREYAMMIGLDPNDIMQRYESAMIGIFLSKIGYDARPNKFLFKKRHRLRIIRKNNFHFHPFSVILLSDVLSLQRLFWLQFWQM